MEISDAHQAIEEPSSHALPLVGRDRELEAIQRWYDSASAGGRLFVIEGEPGIGKTRLAQSFIETVRKRGALVAMAQCYQGEIDLAFTPFAEALDSAIRIWERSHSLDALPELCLLEASRLIPDLAPRSAAAFLASPLDTPGAQRRFFEGVLQVLAAVIGREPPGVLFIDDLHFADDSSLDLLGYMVRRAARWPFFVLVTWRQEEFPARQRLRQLLADAQRDGLADHVLLERLDEQAVDDLLETVRGSMLLDPISTRRLHQESEGLPFFLVEYLNIVKESEKDFIALEQSQAVVADSGSVQPDTVVSGVFRNGSLPMPEGVRNLLQSRLNSASQTAQQLMQAAAVIGRSFDYEILLATSGRSDEEAVSALEELLALGLVIEQPAAEHPQTRISRTKSISEPKLDFSHEKLRTLVYEEMSLGRRRLLHRRVAQALVKQRRPLAAGESSRPALVAFHFQLGGLDEEAASYFKTAGDNARDLYANAEALAHYHSALALGYQNGAGLHEAIGDLLTLKGDYEQALANYETAAAQLEPAERSDALAILEMKLGGVYHRRGDWALAASHYEQSYNQAADACQQARLLTDWSLTTFHAGDIDSAQELAERAYERARAIGDRQALALAHNVLGILANSRGDHRTAIDQLEDSLVLATELDDHIVKIAAMNSLSLALRSTQKQDHALRLVEDALALCVEVGDRHREAALHNNMADLLYDLGRSDEAMIHLKQSAAIFAQIGGEVSQWRPEIWMLTEW